jgi:hypothetical protein
LGGLIERPAQHGRPLTGELPGTATSSLAASIGAQLPIQRRDLCRERLCHRDRDLDLLAGSIRNVDLLKPYASFAAQEMQLGARPKPGR